MLTPLSEEDGALAVVFRMIGQENLHAVADVSVPAVYTDDLLDARNRKASRVLTGDNALAKDGPGARDDDDYRCTAIRCEWSISACQNGKSRSSFQGRRAEVLTNEELYD